jgi:uncharacterized protein (TIGR03382 family)
MLAKALLVSLLGLLAAAPAGAARIDQEGFNSGVGIQYTVVGGGISGPANNQNYWTRETLVNGLSDPDPAFTGQEGADYWVARDLDDLAGATHSVELNIAGVNLSGYTGVTVSILLAANTGAWDPVAAGDYVRLYAVNAVGGATTLLDEFHSFNGGSNVNLESTTFDNTQLNGTFTRFTYNVPITIGTLRFRFEAASTGDLEWVGFDDVRIEGTPIPEPSSAALCMLGLTLLAVVGRRRRL